MSAPALPGAPQVHHENGELHVEGCTLNDLADRHGTPLYVYSKDSMLTALAGYQRALAGRDHLICYAMKANATLAILQTFADAGCGFDIVSGGELARVLAIGVPADRIVFSGVGKTRAEMAQALQAGVRCFNVESEGELAVLSEVAQRCGRPARVSLRINPDVDARTHPYISTGLKSNKFGIAHVRAVATYQRAAALPCLEVVGIDCHIGSQITEIAPYVDALDRLLDLVEAIERAGIPIHHVDVGGGLGIAYTDETPPTAEALVRAMLARIDERGHGHRGILLEPGRSLVGNAGVLVTEVLYLKPALQADGSADPQGTNFCIVDAAMNDLARPAMYQAWMRIEACRQRDAAPVTMDVVGPVCESGDWLGRARPLAVEPGDRLAVLSAGAYGMAMASNYNSRGRAAEVLVEGERATLIRQRERPEELFAAEIQLPG